MSVGRICIRSLILAGRDEWVTDAAMRMEREGVGTLVVTDELDRPVAILNDRDVALRCVGPGMDPTSTPVVC